MEREWTVGHFLNLGRGLVWRHIDAWKRMSQLFECFDDDIRGATASTKNIQVMSLHQRPHQGLHLFGRDGIATLVIRHAGIGIERDTYGKLFAQFLHQRNECLYIRKAVEAHRKHIFERDGTKEVQERLIDECVCVTCACVVCCLFVCAWTNESM